MMENAATFQRVADDTRPQLDLSGWGLRASAILYLSVMIAVPVFVVF